MSINWVYNLSPFHYSVFSWNTRPRKTSFCLKNSHSLPQKQITLSYNRLSGWGKCSSFPRAHSLLALFTPWDFLDTRRNGAHSAKHCGNMSWKNSTCLQIQALLLHYTPLYCFDSANLFQLPFSNTFAMPWFAPGYMKNYNVPFNRHVPPKMGKWSSQPALSLHPSGQRTLLGHTFACICAYRSL